MVQISQTAARGASLHGDCFCVLGKGYDLSISHHQPAERLSFYCLSSLLICSVMVVAATLKNDCNPKEKEVGSTNIYPLSLKACILRVCHAWTGTITGIAVLTGRGGPAELP